MGLEGNNGEWATESSIRRLPDDSKQMSWPSAQRSAYGQQNCFC
jgi:hypothetical protein